MSSLRSLLARIQARTLRRRKVEPKAKALLQDDEGAFLLIRHPQEGRWRLPGGFVKRDESGYDAVVRAVAELTGLRPLDPVPFARIDESHFQLNAMYGDFFQMYATLFLVTRWDGKLAPVAPCEARFFPHDALPSALHEETRLALDALHRHRQTGQIVIL
jgi:ADP-ribose pyrophosphatase YjhB (NUDIX family)